MPTNYTMTSEQYRQQLARTKPQNKYRNVKVTVDDIHFDSKDEAARYGELRIMALAGEISRLEVQPKFVLQGQYIDNMGQRQAAITYSADFRYIRDGDVFVEDVKSPATAKTRAFRMAWKWVKYTHPDIYFIVVQR